MAEKIQFWAVLLWMVGMLIMAAAAVRAVWLEAGAAADEPGARDRSGKKASTTTEETDHSAPGGADPGKA